jgi:hypothetical protein
VPESPGSSRYRIVVPWYVEVLHVAFGTAPMKSGRSRAGGGRGWLTLGPWSPGRPRGWSQFCAPAGRHDFTLGGDGIDLDSPCSRPGDPPGCSDPSTDSSRLRWNLSLGSGPSDSRVRTTIGRSEPRVQRSRTTWSSAAELRDIRRRRMHTASADRAEALSRLPLVVVAGDVRMPALTTHSIPPYG